MKLKFEVDLGLSPRTKTWSVRLGIPVVLLIAGGVAYATLPVTYTDGQKLSAKNLTDNFTSLDTRITTLESQLATATSEIAALQAGNPDCPAGYENTGAAASFLPETIVCTNSTTSDQLVKVGTGASAFWIDRYEATVWSASVASDGGLASAYFTGDAGVPANGQTLTPLYALSVPGALPSSSLTWFQAEQFCRASGKGLPTRVQWLAAARGTVDPVTPNDPWGSDGGVSTACNTGASAGHYLRPTGNALGSGAAASCVSSSGAEDMVGNIWEWTDEWYTSLNEGDAGDVVSGAWSQGTSAFNQDGTWSITSWEWSDTGWSPTLPAAAIRGGGAADSIRSGIFALALSYAASSSRGYIGFRCVLPNSR